MVEGLPSLKNKRAICDGCALGKKHREDFPTHLDKKKRDILELMHTNVCGPYKQSPLEEHHIS